MARLDWRTFRWIAAVWFGTCGMMVATNEALCEETAKQEEWKPLFNGKDLTGWTPKIRGYKLGENHGNTFRVEDGVIKVCYDAYEKFDEKFGHLFYKDTFSNYRLRIEYRFVGEQAKNGPAWALRNSGVMIHGEAPDHMGLDQKFPTSIEVQFLGGDGKAPRTTANLCTPGTNVVMNGKLFTPHCTTSKSKTYHLDQWVTVEVEALGSKSVKHIIDGVTVLEYTKPQLDNGTLLERGTISLQSESHPIEFRKVEIMVLDPK